LRARTRKFRITARTPVFEPNSIAIRAGGLRRMAQTEENSAKCFTFTLQWHKLMA
jgi:hypothetical protein